MAVLVVLVLGWYFMQAPPSSPMPVPSVGEPTPTPETIQTPSTTTGTSAKFDVSITSSGFSPSVINIKKGMTVVFTNNDSSPHWPASNPHPMHTDFPAFNSKPGIPPGGTYSFTTDAVVSFGFHDHLYPSLKGQINITE